MDAEWLSFVKAKTKQADEKAASKGLPSVDNDETHEAEAAADAIISTKAGLKGESTEADDPGSSSVLEMSQDLGEDLGEHAGTRLRLQNRELEATTHLSLNNPDDAAVEAKHKRRVQAEKEESRQTNKYLT